MLEYGEWRRRKCWSYMSWFLIFSPRVVPRPYFRLEQAANGLSESILKLDLILPSPPQPLPSPAFPFPFFLSSSFSFSFFWHEDWVCSPSCSEILAAIPLPPCLVLLAVLVLEPAGQCGAFIPPALKQQELLLCGTRMSMGDPWAKWCCYYQHYMGETPGTHYGPLNRTGFSTRWSKQAQ